MKNTYITWRIKHATEEKWLHPDTQDGIAVWGDYNQAKRYKRADALALAIFFGGIAYKGGQW